MSKILFFVFFAGASQVCLGQPAREAEINPTGTYLFKGEKHRHEIKGHYGEIRVKLVTDSLVALAMYSNNGYPEYSSASFTDTVVYSDNKAVYRSKADPSCQKVFSFEAVGVHIKQIYTNPASTCGFEKGVMPLGFIPKHSSDTPIIQAISRLK